MSLGDVANRYSQIIKEGVNQDNVTDYLGARSTLFNDKASTDALMSYLLSEKSLSSARAYEQEMNSKRYQIAVEDMKKAGINPYWISSLGDFPTYQGSSAKYSTGYETAQKNDETNQKNTVQNVLKGIGAVASAIALIAMML